MEEIKTVEELKKALTKNMTPGEHQYLIGNYILTVDGWLDRMNLDNMPFFKVSDAATNENVFCANYTFYRGPVFIIEVVHGHICELNNLLIWSEEEPNVASAEGEESMATFFATFFKFLTK